MIYFGNKISPAFISWRWIKGCWSRVGNTVLPSLWNATARRLWTWVPLEWDRCRDMDAPQFLRGLCGEGDVCLARGVTQRGTLALDYKWTTRLLPHLHECGVLFRSCLSPTQWPHILGALWSAGQFLLMHMFAVGKKAVMAVGWEYVWFGANGGKPKEQIGSESCMLNVRDLTGWKKGPVLVIPLCFEDALGAHTNVHGSTFLRERSAQQLGFVPVRCQPAVLSNFSG